MNIEMIESNVKRIMAALPPGVTLVAAAKTRTPEEVEAAIRAGVTCIGHNYVQEAMQMIPVVGHAVQWHMIGHLQRNKANKTARLFDMVETIDSWRLAVALDRHCTAVDKVMPVLIEINSGREARKTGVLPEKVEKLTRQLSQLQHLQVQGLMTMGPRFGDPEEARPYFRATRETFERLAALNLPNITMRTLSMGMSNSYQIAIEEGANMVRIGSQIFGHRPDAALQNAAG